MKRKLLLAISLALVVITVGAVGCNGALSFPKAEQAPETGGIIISQQNSGIWVAGEGKVSVVPDVAILSLGVEAQATTVAEAQQQATEAMEAVMNMLDDHGVADKDIKTQYFSIYPVRTWENDKEILVGYRVNNMVTVKIRKVEDTGIIIDAVARAGGDYIRINSISFTVDDPTRYYKEVRDKAMADAEAKAEQLADLGGVNLGKPTYISEGSISLPVTREYYPEVVPAPAPSPVTPITPGETEISLTVQVVYSIG
jgi:uncharacterized protein YggE